MIDGLVKHFVDQSEVLNRLQIGVNGCLAGSDDLRSNIHSIRYRIKDPDHLHDKLIRKLEEAKKEKRVFDIDKGSLFSKINDLVGFRILHLHTRQFEQINVVLQRIFDEQLYRLVEGPIARSWDDESRTYFLGIPIEVRSTESMYTSVHYVFEANNKSKVTFEVQVRTLMEEVWGEVDHSINYPRRAESLACREQIKVLARVTSSCSRLVDSIFLSHADSLPDPVQNPRASPGGRQTRRTAS